MRFREDTPERVKLTVEDLTSIAEQVTLSLPHGHAGVGKIAPEQVNRIALGLDRDESHPVWQKINAAIQEHAHAQEQAGGS